MGKCNPASIPELPVEGSCQMVQPGGQVVWIAAPRMPKELSCCAMRAKIATEPVMPTRETVNGLAWQPI
ncbi:hypothetical protein N790_05690 [Arenimonas malthae CC-JY-1]|uniref:Uncharacterized protein n=1 Tax=Arenimonas malthae CC-JY-1 TaxID=1384054 RepID=A0A091BWZ8_9GAMM|nr:hypothetical protein N790_05690 [Arenimonas malthae CC-JY-1]